MVDDPNEGPPTDVGAKKWKEQFNLQLASVMADPYMSMVGGGGSFGTPMFTVVDPRTMTVVYVQEGGGGGQQHAKIMQLAQQNKPAGI